MRGAKSKINSPENAKKCNNTSPVTTKIKKFGNEGLWRKRIFCIFIKWANCRFSGLKCSFLVRNPYFYKIIEFFYQHCDWTPKRQPFCVDPVTRQASGQPRGPIFGQKSRNLARNPKNGLLTCQTATYRKTEVVQSYLRTWGTYDPNELGPYEPKKWVLYRRKKCRFFGQKWAPKARRATGSTQKCCCLEGLVGWINCRTTDGAANGICNTNYLNKWNAFRQITKKMKLLNLSVDSVAIVRSTILIEKNSTQNVLLCENR